MGYTKKADKVELGKQYVKDNLWKQFWKQKGYELVGIPSAIAAVWFVPFWIGKYLFGDNAIINTITYLGGEVGPVLTRGDYWTFGMILLLFSILFIVANYFYARDKVKSDAIDKYDLYWYDLR